MSEGILGLELNSEIIRFTYLKKLSKGGIFSQKGEFPFSGFSQLKSPADLSRLLLEIIKKENISCRKICLTLSTEESLIHQINLPKMKENELQGIIFDEIERIPRFSNQAFSYIYQVSKLDEQKVRVLFCALTKNTIDLCLKAAEQAGLSVASLEISPLNLVELISNRAEKKNKAEALLVLRKNSSQMAIFLQDECKLYFQMATGQQDLSSSQAAINQANYPRWVEEMDRIFKSCEREFKAPPVEKLWLVWDNESAPDLNKLLAKDLAREVASPQPADFSLKLENDAGLNPMYFTALAAPLNYLRRSKPKLNFRHFLRSVELKRTAQKVKFLAFFYLLGAGLSLGGLAFYYSSSAKDFSSRKEEIGQRIQTLNSQTAQLQLEKSTYLEVRDKLLKQAAYVQLLNRISWSEVFGKVGATLPEGASLSRFEVSESGAVKLEGATFVIDTIAELIRKISRVSFLEDARFSFLKEREAEGKKIVEFGLVTQLKGDSDASSTQESQKK